MKTLWQKGGIAPYGQFFLLPQYFQKSSAAEAPEQGNTRIPHFVCFNNQTMYIQMFFLNSYLELDSKYRSHYNADTYFWLWYDMLCVPRPLCEIPPFRKKYFLCIHYGGFNCNIIHYTGISKYYCKVYLINYCNRWIHVQM